MQSVEVLKRDRVFQGFASMDDVTVEYTGLHGAKRGPITRLSVERGDAVGVLVFNRDSEQFLFVRQLRVPLIRHDEPWIVEVAAGGIERGETPEEAAIREVEEEIGYRAKKLEHLGEMYGSPGGLSEKLTLFYAEVEAGDRTGDGGGVDDHEDVEIVPMAAKQAYEAVDRFQLKDAKTLITLLRVRSRFATS